MTDPMRDGSRLGNMLGREFATYRRASLSVDPLRRFRDRQKRVGQRKATGDAGEDNRGGMGPVGAASAC